MKLSIFVILLVSTVIHALPRGNIAGKNAAPCSQTDCVLPDCRCSDVNIPGNLQPNQTPQFVILTFDDAVNINNMPFYRQVLYNRKNPDTCPIQAAFFVSHEYSDYTMIHELHSRGHEIALHSITHTPSIPYWRDANVSTLERELADQRAQMAHLANIPSGDIRGIRMPFLQMAGNAQFEMLNKNEFLYDLSWPTQSFISPGLWPYSLNYRSTQDCVTAPPCPTESFPDTWVIPMIMWFDEVGSPCAMADTCLAIPQNETGLTNWMISEFHKQYNGNRAPFGVYIHAAWFSLNSTHLRAYERFLDYLGSLDDVFITGPKRVIDWVKNPKQWFDMIPDEDEDEEPECQRTYAPACQSRSCQLCKEGTEVRFMSACVACPNSYPWLNNHLGQDLHTC